MTPRRAYNSGTPCRIGTTDEAALSLFLRWEPESFMIINAYTDASGTHKDSEFMILAGYIARLGKWHAFDADWRRLLKRNGLQYLHAVEHLRQRCYQQCGLDAHKLSKKYETPGD
jgi:hypothetical protein